MTHRLLLPAAVALALAGLLLLSACPSRDDESSATAPSGAAAGATSASGGEPSATAQVPTPETSGDASGSALAVRSPKKDGQRGAVRPTRAARMKELVAELPKKGRCSLLMGCPPGDALEREGKVAVPALIELCGWHVTEKHWRQRAFDILGRSRSPEAGAFLANRLDDPSEPLRAEAALALGHLRHAAARPALEATLDVTSLERDASLHVAALYALARLGDAEKRAALGAALAPVRLRALNPGQLRTTLTAIRWLEAKEWSATVLGALSHDNLFVRRDALALLADWRLEAAVPHLIARLDDESSGVRRDALALLQKLTGQRHKRTRAQWETWCEGEESCTLLP